MEPRLYIDFPSPAFFVYILVFPFQQNFFYSFLSSTSLAIKHWLLIEGSYFLAITIILLLPPSSQLASQLQDIPVLSTRVQFPFELVVHFSPLFTSPQSSPIAPFPLSKITEYLRYCNVSSSACNTS